jgi:hypothetical protein
MHPQEGTMRAMRIAALAVLAAACGGAHGASDRPRNVAADSAFRADSATLAAIVQRDAAERHRVWAMFPGFVALARHYQGQQFDVAAFSTDDDEDKDGIPGFLARYEAPFDPLYIKPWQPGELSGALSPLGFHLTRAPWDRPYVAVLDPHGDVVAQWNAATNLAAIDAAIQSQLAR